MFIISLAHRSLTKPDYGSRSEGNCAIECCTWQGWRTDHTSTGQWCVVREQCPDQNNRVKLSLSLSVSRSFFSLTFSLSPWGNRSGWLGVKHQWLIIFLFLLVGCIVDKIRHVSSGIDWWVCCIVSHRTGHADFVVVGCMKEYLRFEHLSVVFSVVWRGKHEWVTVWNGYIVGVRFYMKELIKFRVRFWHGVAWVSDPNLMGHFWKWIDQPVRELQSKCLENCNLNVWKTAIQLFGKLHLNLMGHFLMGMGPLGNCDPNLLGHFWKGLGQLLGNFCSYLQQQLHKASLIGRQNLHHIAKVLSAVVQSNSPHPLLKQGGGCYSQFTVGCCTALKGGGGAATQFTVGCCTALRGGGGCYSQFTVGCCTALRWCSILQ